MSVVVATMSRPEDLTLTIASLLAGTVLPAEVIVADASADDRTEILLNNFRSTFTRPEFRYVRTRPGLPGQRNAGLGAARGEVVLFLDDDVTLAPDYLAQLLGAFADGRVVGATGLVTNQYLPPWRVRALQWFFRQVRYARRSYLQRSGLPTFLYRPAATTPVRILTGCNMAFRRQALAGFQFDPRLNYFDDDDVSLYAGGKGLLLQVPAARVEHRLAAAARPDTAAKTRRRVLEQRLLHRRHLAPHILNVACYYYSVAGAAVMAALRGRFGAVWATALGLWDVVRTRGARRVDAILEERFLPRPER